VSEQKTTFSKDDSDPNMS